MVGKIVTGKSFKGLAKYLTADKSRVAWVATRNTFEERPAAIASEMHDESLTSSRTKKPVLHIAIALDPSDTVTRAGLEQIADRTLRDLGLSHHQVMIVAHSDKAHTHIHLMVNRVHGGRAWDGFRDRYRLRLSLEAQERDMGLRRTGRNADRQRDYQPDRTSPAKTNPSDGRLFAALVRQVAGEDFRRSTSWEDLTTRLASHGLRLEPRGSGMVVTDGKHFAKLSAVGRLWSRPQLEHRFGAFKQQNEPERPSRTRSTPERSTVPRRRGRHLVIPRSQLTRVGRRIQDLATQPGRSADEAVMRSLTRRTVSLAMRLGRHAGREQVPVMRLIDLGVRYDRLRRGEGERQLAGRAVETGVPGRQHLRELKQEIGRQGAALGERGYVQLQKIARGEGASGLGARQVLALIEKIREKGR